MLNGKQKYQLDQTKGDEAVNAGRTHNDSANIVNIRQFALDVPLKKS
ncbi:MAG: hypothetical protein K1X56_12885 [Flavobacteriales bacterium]|nr:hypothetical protein [Flavobacteriales bacterium]